MKKILTAILILVTAASVFAKTDVNSQIEQLREKASKHYRAQEFDEALVYYDKILNEYEIDDDLRSKLLCSSGICYAETGQNDKALTNLLGVIKTADKNSGLPRFARTYTRALTVFPYTLLWKVHIWTGISYYDLESIYILLKTGFKNYIFSRYTLSLLLLIILIETYKKFRKRQIPDDSFDYCLKTNWNPLYFFGFELGRQFAGMILSYVIISMISVKGGFFGFSFSNVFYLLTKGQLSNFTLVLVFLIVILKKEELKSVFKLPDNYKKTFRALASGVALYFYSFIAIGLILVSIPILFGSSDWDFTESWSETKNKEVSWMQPEPDFNLVTVLLLIFGVALSVLWEEIFYRGLLYNYIRSNLGATSAIILSSFIFMLIHDGSPHYLFKVFFFGVTFALVTEKTKSLLPAILIHFVNNIWATFCGG